MRGRGANPVDLERNDGANMWIIGIVIGLLFLIPPIYKTVFAADRPQPVTNLDWVCGACFVACMAVSAYLSK